MLLNVSSRFWGTQESFRFLVKYLNLCFKDKWKKSMSLEQHYDRFSFGVFWGRTNPWSTNKLAVIVPIKVFKLQGPLSEGPPQLAIRSHYWSHLQWQFEKPAWCFSPPYFAAVARTARWEHLVENREIGVWKICNGCIGVVGQGFWQYRLVSG